MRGGSTRKSVSWRAVAWLVGSVLIRLNLLLRLIKYKSLWPLHLSRLPWSTKIYGRICFSTYPCGLYLEGANVLGNDIVFGTRGDAKINIERNVSLNTGCHVIAMAGIKIGKRTAIGEFVSIRDQDHEFSKDKGILDGYKTAAIEIGESVWIGRGCYVGPGTRIGSGSVVAANSVVRGSFPGGVLIAGNPAVVKKELE